MDGSQPVSQLADYLERLSAEGKPESSGQWTVDYHQAREKLGARLFADPHCALLKIVQCAVASLSPSIHVATRRGQLLLRFYSEKLDLTLQKDLGSLLYRPLESHVPLVWQQLMLGLQAAQAFPNSQIGFATRSPRGGLGLLLQRDRLSTLDIPRNHQDNTECVFLVKSPALDLAAARRVLQQRCRYCPVPVYWNGHLLNGKFAGPPPPPPYGWLVERLYLSRHPVEQGLVLAGFRDRPAAVYDLGFGYQDYYSRGDTLLHQWRSYNPKGPQSEMLFPRTPAPKYKLQRTGGLLPLTNVPKGGLPVYLGGYRSGYAFRGSAPWQCLYVEDFIAFNVAPFRHRAMWGRRQALPCGLGELRLPSLPDDGEPNRIYLVHYGVTLEPVEVELEVAGAQIVLCDPYADTDLSGLAVADRGRLQRVVDWLRLEVAALKVDAWKTLHWAEKYQLPRGWREAVYLRQNLHADTEELLGGAIKPIAPEG